MSVTCPRKPDTKSIRPDGRGYYSGVLALIGQDAAGNQAMDSAILIRTAEIDESGRLRVSAGATLARHSDPDSEAAETSTKLEGLLSTFSGGGRSGAGVPNRPGLHLARNPLVRRALYRRNVNLAQFWLEGAKPEEVCHAGTYGPKRAHDRC